MILGSSGRGGVSSTGKGRKLKSVCQCGHYSCGNLGAILPGNLGTDSGTPQSYFTPGLLADAFSWQTGSAFLDCPADFQTERKLLEVV